MRVAVIGAGIVGVSTAFELAADGHAVTVFERCGSAAAEASFASGGLISPGTAVPQAGAGWSGAQWRGAFGGRSALRVHGLHAGAPAWLWRAFRAGGAKTGAPQRLRMHRLAAYSRERLHGLTRTLRLDYEHSRGLLVLLRNAKDLALAQPSLKLLTAYGIAHEVLDGEQCRRHEPGLSDATALHAGIRLADDEVANGRQLALLLRGEAERLGTRFRFHAEALRITPGRTPQLAWRSLAPPDSTTAADDAVRSEGFDAVVVCAAIGAHTLLAPHGLRLPLLPVHGHSVTAPMRHHDDEARRGPRSALIDERHQVTISRLGTRLRVTGGAELGGTLDRQHDATLATLYRVLNDWFPGVAQMGQALRWKGVRPTLPDGPPVLGPSGIEGVWLNLGHGAHGVAMAAGAARVLADALAGRPAAIDLDGVTVDRLRR